MKRECGEGWSLQPVRENKYSVLGFCRDVSARSWLVMVTMEYADGDASGAQSRAKLCTMP